MKKAYQKPTMTAVQLQYRTMLLSGSPQVQSFKNSNVNLNYVGSDEDLEEEAR